MKNKERNIVITHGYSDSNKGDFAITLATLKVIKQYYPASKLTLLSTFRKNDPDFEFHNRFVAQEGVRIIQGLMATPYIGSAQGTIENIKAVVRLSKSYVQLLLVLMGAGKLLGGKEYTAWKAIKDADLVVVKGGQFIYNDAEDVRGWLFLWRTLKPIEIAQKLKKKVVVFGQSIGPFFSSKSERYAMKRLRKCDSVVVREQMTMDMLTRNGLEANSFLAPDLAFYLQPTPTDQTDNYQSNNCFGVTMVNWNFPEQPEKEAKKAAYRKALVESIAYCYNTHQLVPVLISQVTVRHHGSGDEDLIDEIIEKLEALDIPFIRPNEDFSATEMSALYDQCKFLIGTRLHSCILAMCASTPVVAIRYQGFKTQGVMKMVGLSDYVLDINTIKSVELNSKIDAIIDKEETIVKSLQEVVPKLRAEIEQNALQFL